MRPPLDKIDHNRREEFEKRETDPDRNFYVRASSVSAVRRALGRAPGGARVVGRHDRETILCTHPLEGHSLTRHWKVIVQPAGESRPGGCATAAARTGPGRAIRSSFGAMKAALYNPRGAECAPAGWAPPTVLEQTL